MRKITKSQVRAMFRKMKASEVMHLVMCPSKMYPNFGHPFNMAIEFTFDSEGIELRHDGQIATFESTLNSFEYYNCTNETGLYTHFYIVE